MLLVIDSATAACSAALIAPDGALVDERHELVGRGHAERLAPMIAELLAGRTPGSILVDCGPGSFTGLRVGLAAAHGMAIGWGVKLAGYSSLAAIAVAIPGRPLAVALKGGHDELFVQQFDGDPLRPLADLQSLRPDDAAAAISSLLVAGDGAEALVTARGHGHWQAALPRAADARLLPEAMRNLPARPIYGRSPDARAAG